MSSAPKFHYIQADKEEISIAKEAERRFGKGMKIDIELLREIIRHPGLKDALSALLSEIAENGNVAIASAETTLSSQEAADFLNVSRPFLNKILDAGIIPSHKTGVHRRIYFKDVLEYKRKRVKASRGLDTLTEESEKLGIGWKSHS